MGIVVCALNVRLRVVQNASEARTLLQNTDAVPLGGQGTASAHTTAQSQGYYLPASGDIILIADHLPSAEHAVWAAAQTLGHQQADRTALPAAARELRNLALVARQNRSVNALASAIARQRGLDDNTPAQRQQAAEAALAELAATRHSGDWHALQQRYGVRMPQAQREGVLDVQARFADKLQGWFGRYAGMRQNEGAQVGAVLAEMLAGGDGQRAARGAGDVGLGVEAQKDLVPNKAREVKTDTIQVPAGVGREAWIRPNDIRFSQRTITENNYLQIMESGGWKWSQENPLIVIERPDGTLITLDNRRLSAAQQASNVDIVPVRILKETEKYLDYKTWRTAKEAFDWRATHPKTLANGGLIPQSGLIERPTVLSKDR
ncbi:hypothetical protein SAMN02745857_02738 [Andreprevotia lacus DSM 23236]|uniref:Uncharacterized protein n=1 Tax=Andreprevotia lacus DSM 23236 TaxID=1121001 RepID=A0A1W1XTF9_9NEIS|nr:hypothetical protein [Andreprevotia lacus]SMC27177.1 hypothetical protein SAMN02745857_02738 [Andreprevotia lacus DSM 23236]